jgi:hypothetical protein
MRVAFGRLVVGAALLAAAGGCNSNLWNGEGDLVVVNTSSQTLTVFVDGRAAFDVEGRAARTLDGVGEGRHVLEAFDVKGRLVDRRAIELQGAQPFYWRVESR